MRLFLFLVGYSIAGVLAVGGLALGLFAYRPARWLAIRTEPTSEYWSNALMVVGAVCAVFGLALFLLLLHHHLRFRLAARPAQPRGFEAMAGGGRDVLQ